MYLSTTKFLKLPIIIITQLILFKIYESNIDPLRWLSANKYGKKIHDHVYVARTDLNVFICIKSISLSHVRIILCSYDNNKIPFSNIIKNF